MCVAAVPHGSAVRPHHQACDAGAEGQVEGSAHGPDTHSSPSRAGGGHWVTGRGGQTRAVCVCMCVCAHLHRRPHGDPVLIATHTPFPLTVLVLVVSCFSESTLRAPPPDVPTPSASSTNVTETRFRSPAEHFYLLLVFWMRRRFRSWFPLVGRDGERSFTPTLWETARYWRCAYWQRWSDRMNACLCLFARPSERELVSFVWQGLMFFGFIMGFSFLFESFLCSRGYKYVLTLSLVFMRGGCVCHEVFTPEDWSKLSREMAHNLRATVDSGLWLYHDGCGTSHSIHVSTVPFWH